MSEFLDEAKMDIEAVHLSRSVRMFDLLSKLMIDKQMDSHQLVNNHTYFGLSLSIYTRLGKAMWFATTASDIPGVLSSQPKSYRKHE